MEQTGSGGGSDGRPRALRRRAERSDDSELLEACRDAVAFLSGPPLHLTLRAFVEAALRDRLHTELTRTRGLELVEEDADAFPPRGQALRVGRPLVRA